MCFVALLGGACTASAQGVASAPTLPNPDLHPGVADPAVTQDNIDSTICMSGYTKGVRPPSSYTSNLKRQQIQDEGLPGGPEDYEEDHVIPLELGGAPRDEKNLFAEPYENHGAKLAAPGTGAESKDKVEKATNRRVCSGSMTLADAQTRIASNWQQLGADEGMLSESTTPSAPSTNPSPSPPPKTSPSPPSISQPKTPPPPPPRPHLQNRRTTGGPGPSNA